MRIGYAVEGSTDRAVIRGLTERWCPGAELVEGHFRGSTGLSIRREIAKICAELRSKGAAFFVFLRDANRQDWRAVQRSELDHVPSTFRDFTLYGVAHRNIECWLRADPYYLARELDLKIAPETLRSEPDPKGIVEGALSGKASREKQDRIAAIVRHAPAGEWVASSESFEKFYEDARDMAQRHECAFPNERDA
jgi:hypothetical protein